MEDVRCLSIGTMFQMLSRCKYWLPGGARGRGRWAACGSKTWLVVGNASMSLYQQSWRCQNLRIPNFDLFIHIYIYTYVY